MLISYYYSVIITRYQHGACGGGPLWKNQSYRENEGDAIRTRTLRCCLYNILLISMGFIPIPYVHGYTTVKYLVSDTVVGASSSSNRMIWKITLKLGIKILNKNWDEYDCQHLVITTKHLTKEKIYELIKEMVEEIGLQRPPSWTQPLSS